MWAKELKKQVESVVETLEIMADPELMAALRQSRREAARGETIPWEEVRERLLRMETPAPASATLD